MDILAYKKYEPLFGRWTITRLLEQNANRMLFELEDTSGEAPQRAVLRTVFIPQKRSGVQALMEQMGREMEPAAFAQEIAGEVRQELHLRECLKGQPHIVALREQQIVEREDKSGLDVLMRLEALLPLDKYLRQQELTEQTLFAIGIDICEALESCRKEGILHGNICKDAIFVTQDGGFKLGRFEKAKKAEKNNSAPDVKALGELLCQLAQTQGTVRSAEFVPYLQKIWRENSSEGTYDPVKIRREMEQTAYKAGQAGIKKEPARQEAAPSAQLRDAEQAKPVPPKPVMNTAAVLAQALDKTSEPIRPGTAPEPEKDLVEKVAGGYKIQDEPETAPSGSRTKWLAAAIGGLACLTVLGFAGVRFAMPAIRGILSSSGSAVPAPTATQAPAGETEPGPAETSAAAEPTLSPEELEEAEREQRMQQVLATMQDICTGAQPQITDPATWNDAGKALMERLEADPYYQEWNFTVDSAAFAAVDSEQNMRADMAAALGQWQEGAAAAALAEQYPYLIAVNRAASTVTVYAPDEEGRYTVPYMAMVCSGGPDTPTGFWFTPIRYQWRTLVGPCYGQNATRIWNSYLFHSVPYYTQHKDDVEYDQYNQLGTQASLGCIRLAVVDVKWIFDNCPLGTPVVIYDDENDPGPMGKPGTIYIDPTNEEMRGWDPTDPDPANPWGDEYLPGTAIRSDAAWAEYNAAMTDGRWNDTINVTDLRGESTDSAVEGTRG